MVCIDFGSAAASSVEAHGTEADLVLFLSSVCVWCGFDERRALPAFWMHAMNHKKVRKNEMPRSHIFLSGRCFVLWKTVDSDHFWIARTTPFWLSRLDEVSFSSRHRQVMSSKKPHSRIGWRIGSSKQRNYSVHKKSLDTWDSRKDLVLLP